MSQTFGSALTHSIAHRMKYVAMRQRAEHVCPDAQAIAHLQRFRAKDLMRYVVGAHDCDRMRYGPCFANRAMCLK